MGNTTGTRRRSGNLEVDPGSSPNRVDNFPGQKFLYQPSEDMDEALQNVLRSHMKDAQYEPVPMRRGSISDRPSKLPTFFKWEGPAKDVYVSGTFNNWKVKIPLVKSQGTFYTIIDLPEGEHQYKFHVDGEWRHDLSEPVIQNNLGSNNNVVRVQPSDFEVFEALRRDGENHKSTQSLSGSPPGRYSQEVPERSSTERTSGGPPLLPPHLLQVILNKNIPISCEPTLLPEPNHVMLNHLYALSIKDGVMVLSATHRYRKKFVTTLLYKPIS